MIPKHKLSERQAQVIFLFTLGYSRKMVADKLGISINTIKGHAKAAFKKLGAVNSAQAAANYYRCQPSATLLRPSP